jgi:Tol biopolymer transport system component
MARVVPWVMLSRLLLLSLFVLLIACSRAEAPVPTSRASEPIASPAPPAASAAAAAHDVAEAASVSEPPPAAVASAVDAGLPQAVRPFPSGLSGEIVFQSDRDGQTRVYAVDLSAGTVRRVGPAGNWSDEEPQWSPDGHRIAFASTRAQAGNSDIFVMDPDGSNVIRVTDHAAPEQGPAWAADGQSLFFTSTRNGRAEIYRVWLTDKRVERVTSGFDRAIMPAASPDGKYLAYAAQTIMHFQLHLLDLQAGTTRQITAGGGACHPNWSPDSQEVAFVRLDAEPSRLEAVRETGPRVLLADQKLWSYYPDYSSDARYVAFSVSPEHHRGEDWDLAVMDTQQPGRFVRLTSGPGNDRMPDWRPPVR